MVNSFYLLFDVLVAIKMPVLLLQGVTVVVQAALLLLELLAGTGRSTKS